MTKARPSCWNGTRFVIAGGVYTIRVKLLLRGFDGWAVYAGTFTGKPFPPEELVLAEQAREQTVVDADAPAAEAASVTSQ
jgi:hypothetical protein